MSRSTVRQAGDSAVADAGGGGRAKVNTPVLPTSGP